MITDRITSATPADVPSLNRLINSAYRGDSSRLGWTTEADLLDGIRTDEAGLLAMLAHPQATILTYRDGETPLGCVYLEVQDDALYLGMLTVAPALQDRGIGRQLLAAAEAFAHERGCRSIVMTVIPERHELLAWYERRGYRPTGETKPFPSDPRFGIPRRPLSFIVLKKELPTG